jgi:D-cysteine desulfhydrase family pyridoxal phosphate-dependent enzyme
MKIEEVPRIKLASLPTPLLDATRLSATLGGPRILIKRDDLTGLAMGGNKSRKLEFILADAKAKGADILITSGAAQSNFAVQMAAAGCKLDMRTILILLKGQHTEVQGNLLLGQLLDAEVRYMEVAPAEFNKGFKALEQLGFEAMEQLANELRGKGHNPYVIRSGGDIPLGTVGYVVAAREIAQQLSDLGLQANYLVVAHGAGGTQAGLALGAKYYKLPFRVIGCSVSFAKEGCQNFCAELYNNTARMLGLDLTISPDEVVVFDDYIGDGYGIPSKACKDAIKLVAKTEGIFLDPVYTGKAMAGLIDLIHKNKFASSDTVIFIHTGGVPALFAYNKELMTQAKPQSTV